MLLEALRTDRGGQALLAVLAVAVVVVPVLNLAVPPDNPLYLSTYTVTLLGTSPADAGQSAQLEGRFRTAPAPGAEAALTFVSSTGQDFPLVEREPAGP